MRITPQQFTYGMSLLAAVHGDGHALYKNPEIADIWFEFFTRRYSNEKFLRMIKYYLGVSHWPPKVPNDICELWEKSGEERRPGENYLAFQEQSYESCASLPSTEAQAQLKELEELKNISPEQMLENRKRLALMAKIAFEMKDFNTEDKQSKIDYFTKASLHELNAIAVTCYKAKQLSVKGDGYGNLKVSPNALFEDMHKYFHSGSEKYRQIAIDWASDPSNGCELVKDGLRVVDIKQIDF